MRSRKYLCQHGIMESWNLHYHDGRRFTIPKGRNRFLAVCSTKKDEAAAREAADERARKRERERIEAKAEKAREQKESGQGGTLKCARRVERLFQFEEAKRRMMIATKRNLSLPTRLVRQETQQGPQDRRNHRVLQGRQNLQVNLIPQAMESIWPGY